MHKVSIKNNSFLCNEGQTILDAARQNGLTLSYSCSNGRCSTCMVNLLEGTVEYSGDIKPSFNVKKNHILTCIGVPKSNLLIDTEDLSSYGLSEVRLIPARISALELVSSDTMKLSLRIPPNQKFLFREGQYVDIIKGSVRRSYSLASTMNDLLLEFYIKNHENGQMSDYLFKKAKVNDLLRIEGPKGTFFLRSEHEKKDIVFLATGTGIAPIKSIVSAINNLESLRLFRRVIIIWGQRTSKDLYWSADSFQSRPIEFVPVLSREGDKKRYVQDLLNELDIDYSNAVYYACGSPSMINACEKVLADQGVREKDIYKDEFLPTN